MAHRNEVRETNRTMTENADKTEKKMNNSYKKLESAITANGGTLSNFTAIDQGFGGSYSESRVIVTATVDGHKCSVAPLTDNSVSVRKFGLGGIMIVNQILKASDVDALIVANR